MKRILFSLLTAAFAVGVCPAAEPDETPLPGLWQIKNGDWSTLRRELGPVMGTVDGTYTSPIDGVETRWAEFDSWHYEGQVYLEAGKTYTFGTYVDDFCDISIGGQKVHSQLGYAFGSASYACTATGWHDIVFDVWDAGGGFGSYAAWPLGIAWNTAGQTAQDPQSGWTQLVDPGDGSLFRVVGKPKRAVVVENVVCAQRYPWNGMVDIDYEVVCDNPDADVWVYATGMDNDMNVSMAPRTLTGDGVDGPVKAGKHRMTWNVTADYPGFAAQSFTVKMCALVGGAPYLVVDLSGGVDALSYPVSYLNAVPEGGWTEEYKGDKLVLRLIPPGTFLMGSPSDELGRVSNASNSSDAGNEQQHLVTLTAPYYIGVFEVTQHQYELVMGNNPSKQQGEFRPVNLVSYEDIRGSVNGTAWPIHNQVDANSFMGRLRAKGNMLFDLPTEAQWEYACRAGTGTALNNGKNLSATTQCTNLADVARYGGNTTDGRGGYSSGSTTVGSYLPNIWGLYDMHGNVVERCLDWYSVDLSTNPELDPRGPNSGSWRVLKGGGTYYSSYSYAGHARYCRSASRLRGYSGGGINSEYYGFRVACFPAD